MKIIYKLPKYLALITLIGIVVTICYDIRQAQTRTLFDLIENGVSTARFDVTIMGMDLYTIFNSISVVFVIALAALRYKVINVRSWVAALVGTLLYFQMSFGSMVIKMLDDKLAEAGFQALTMTGQYMYATVPATLILMWLLALILKKDVRQMLDFAAPLWLLTMIFVRVACFTAGCCGIDPFEIAGVEIAIPVQLVEVLLDLLLMQLVFSREAKHFQENSGPGRPGQMFFIAVGGYSAFRFVLDFARDIPALALGLTLSQIYSLIWIIILVIILKGRSKSGSPAPNCEMQRLDHQAMTSTHRIK